MISNILINVGELVKRRLKNIWSKNFQSFTLKQLIKSKITHFRNCAFRDARTDTFLGFFEIFQKIASKILQSLHYLTVSVYVPTNCQWTIVLEERVFPKYYLPLESNISVFCQRCLANFIFCLSILPIFLYFTLVLFMCNYM